MWPQHRCIVLVLAAMVLSTCLLAGCAIDLTEPAFSDYPSVLRADVAPTWSRDNRYIAYRRVIYSQDGPPGIYIVSRQGGKPRLLTPASFYYPGEMRFSPDGRHLVAILDLYWLVLIDVATGAVTQLRYSDNGPTSPDWSPDGHRIVYGRKFFYSGQPLDSIAIRTLDLATGVETPLVHDGEIVYGTDTRWSPNGEWILLKQDTGRIMIVRPDGSELRKLTDSAYYSDLHWYERPDAGLRGAVFRVATSGNTLYAPANGKGLYPWKPYGSWDEFSFDGRDMVVSRIAPRDSVALLFIQSVDDFASSSWHQITFYAPTGIPASTTSDRSAATRP
jgi:dipeptidyl aminopeptidase/acylaminoacyl peptidase